MNFKLDSSTNYIYTFFVFSAKDCAPNRDGGTGEIRQDMHGRVFTTQECFNQNVKNGIFYGKHSGVIATPGALLLSCKNDAFGPQTLKGAQKSLLDQIAAKLKKDTDKLTPSDVFLNVFDIPCFGMVNSDGVKDAAVDYSLSGSCGLIYLPTTLMKTRIENRGISSAFSGVDDKHKAAFKKLDSCKKYQEAPSDVVAPNSIAGSHYTDFLTEGVFAALGVFNVRQLEFIAQNKFKMEDQKEIRKRIQELYELYAQGIWEGFKLLTYASTMRRGQQPVSLYSCQTKELCDGYITAPCDLLRTAEGDLPIHESVDKTLATLKNKLPDWFSIFKNNWELLKGKDLIKG